MAGVALPLQAAEATQLKDGQEKFSYAVGMMLGGQWRRQSIDINLEILLRGIKDAQAKKTLLDEKEAQMVITEFQQDHRAKLAEKNKKEGEAFLEENKKKAGVVTRPSGLQYKVLAEGKGESPSTNDIVTVNYRGTFVDGSEFDSSYKSDRPATFGLRPGGVIEGWREALPLMKTGAKWQLFIPANLAYAERGRGPVGPNAALLFDVELISFQSPQPAVTSDIIKVPSKDELEKGAKPEVIKASELDKYIAEEKAKAGKAQTNK
jgi:FKBP-type peptidyl-prolyl cis-trans isomerase FklB